jgi:RNA polymerase sigma-70 factor (ECF subfamily)
VEGLVSPLLNPEEALDEVVLREELHKTLNKLLPQYKHVLYARYILNMPVADIAKKLAVTLKSAESMLFRAKKAFVKTHEHI